MPAQDNSRPSPALKKLLRLQSLAQTSFSQEHPTAADYLTLRKLDLTAFKFRDARESADPLTLNTQTFDQSLAQVLQQRAVSSHDATISHLTREEFASIIQKLQTALQQPPDHIASESLLYLEQQLSDLLGISVVGSLDGHQLPYHTGTLEAEPHRKRFPDDQLSPHEQYLEAGMRQSRSFFGWYITQNTLTEQAEQRERYTISLPLALLPEWQTDHEALKQWYRFRKVLVINPFDSRAVVACIADARISPNPKYQFGASPEVVREGLFWSPACQGKACLLFVDDPSDTLSLGPVQLNIPNT